MNNNVARSHPTIEHYKSAAEVETLVNLFVTKQLPYDEWTHEAHLTVGLWHLLQFTKDEAICFLRKGIISYNETVGIENSPNSGYHETLTLFWVWVIDNFIKQNLGKPIYKLCLELLSSKYGSRDLGFKFYSKEHLFSIKGRAVWVAPDKHDLDFSYI